MKEKQQFFYVHSTSAPTEATIQLEENAVYKARNYTNKFLEKQFSPKLQEQQVDEHFRGHAYRKVLAKKCRRDIDRAKKIDSPMKREGNFGQL